MVYWYWQLLQGVSFFYSFETKVLYESSEKQDRSAREDITFLTLESDFKAKTT